MDFRKRDADYVIRLDRGEEIMSSLTRLLEELCVEGGHKAVVFSEWERMTAMAATQAPLIRQAAR